MIGKQIKGTDFYGCLDYVLGKERAELIGGNMVGETPAELTQEFQLSVQRHERTRNKKPTRKVVYHATLSVPPEETLNNDTWCMVAENYLQAMGFDDNQYILARHTDTEHNHVHIVASRLRLNGSTVSEWQDYKRSEELIRDLEKKYELTPAPSSFEKERRSPTTGESRLTKRTGEISARKKLQNTIDQLTQDSLTMPDLIGQLKDQGIDVRVSPTPTGDMGISYQLNGIAFSGTHLGRAYTFKGLQKYRGVSCSEKQEQKVVEQARNSPAAQAEEQQQQQAQLAHQNEIRKRQEEEEKKSRTETTPDSYPATLDNLDSEQQLESRVNPKQQQQAAKTRHKKRSRFVQQQSVILDDDNISTYGQSIIDENDSKVKHEQELFEVIIATTSTIQQQRRLADVDGDQRETKLHTREYQVADASPEIPAPVLPDRNENNWQAVQEYLVGVDAERLVVRHRLLPKQIVKLLHVKGWIYADDEGQTVFVERTLDGETTGAFVLNDSKFSSIRLDPDEPAAPDDSDTTLTGCFWVATITPIQRAVLTSDPVEVLSVMALDPEFNQTPTLYLAIDNVFAIPKEFLEKLPTVVVGLKGDEEGNAVSEEILAALPQARRINPGMAGWNKILTDEREDIKSEVQELHEKQTGDQGLEID